MVVGTKGSAKGELAPHKAKQKDRKHQELLALALGVNLGSQGALLWKPLKILACSQITPSPLSRRTTLKDGPEKHCSYEKIHNFKVSTGCVTTTVRHVRIMETTLPFKSLGKIKKN